MRACADLARLAEEISELEFEGVERDNDALALRAQIANRYYDLSEHLLEQSVGLVDRGTNGVALRAGCVWFD